MAILVIGTVAIFWWPTADDSDSTASHDWPVRSSSTEIKQQLSKPATAQTTATDADSDTRFVLLSPDGRPRLNSNLIGEVLAIALRNDIVEIRHDGELTVPSQLVDTQLEIRAAGGCRPVLIPELKADGTFEPLFRCQQPVKLRGLTLASPDGAGPPPIPHAHTLVHVERGSLDVEDCDFDLRCPGFEDIAIRIRSASRVDLTNSRFHGGVALDLDLQTRCQLVIDNSLLHGACPLILHHHRGVDSSTVSLSKSTVIAETICSLVTLQSLELQEKPPIVWRAQDSVFVARDALFSLSRMATAGTKDTFDRVLGDSLWCVADCRSERCVFAIEQRFLVGNRTVKLFRPATRQAVEQQKRIPRISTLAHFCDVAGAKDEDSVEVNFPVDAVLLAPASLPQLEQLQSDLLAEAAKSVQRDLSDRGVTIER
jgi:hypothetical protein